MVNTHCYVTPDIASTVDNEGGKQVGSDHEQTRQQLLKELIRNESEFLTCLNTIQEQIAAPILDRVYTDPDCCDALPGLPISLSIVKMLHAAHSKMVLWLEQIFQSWCDRSSTIGDVICDHIGILRILLRQYSRGIGIVAAALRWSFNNKDSRFLPAVLTSTLKEDVLHLLSSPLGRLPYYECMLRRIFSRTDLDHPDSSELSRSIKFVRNACTQIANVKEFCRQHQAICYIEQLLGIHLVSRKRELLLQGELSCSFNDKDSLNSPQEGASLRNFISSFTLKRRPFLSGVLDNCPILAVLFNDVMVLSRKRSEDKLSIFDVIHLRSCSIKVSQNSLERVIEITCHDGRVYHFSNPNPRQFSQWVQSLMKAHAGAAKEDDDSDIFRINVVYRNERCDLRIEQHSLIITPAKDRRCELVCLELHNIRLFSDDSNDCAVQLLSARKHVVFSAKTVDDAHRLIQFIKMEQSRVRSLTPAPMNCCERSKSLPFHSNFAICSLCNCFVSCSACLDAAILMSNGDGFKSVACRPCQTLIFQSLLSCPIPESVCEPTKDRNWFSIKSCKNNVGCYEARRIRLNRRLGLMRLAELDVKPSVQVPRLEPDHYISVPIFKLRDDLDGAPKEIPILMSSISRVQCASCLEFKSLNDENRFCGICGHADNIVNDRLAFLFTWHSREKALVKQQLSLLNSYLPNILNEINIPSYNSGLAYRPPILTPMTNFDKKSSSFAASHLAFIFEGKFIGKEKCPPLAKQSSLNSGIAAICASMRMLLDLVLLMLGELEDHLHNWNCNSSLAEMFMRYFPLILSCIRLFVSNYYEGMDKLSSDPWKFRFQYLQLRAGIPTSAFEMFLMTFDRIRSLYCFVYRENLTEGGSYCDQLQQLSGGLTLMINRIHDRHTSIRMARLLLLPVPIFSSERFLFHSIIRTMILGEPVMQTLLILSTEFCILTLGRTSDACNPVVYTCPRRDSNFVGMTVMIANTELQVRALQCTFKVGKRSQQVLLFGRSPSETDTLQQTLVHWKNAPQKSLMSVTVHSPRFQSGKSMFDGHGKSAHFSAKDTFVTPHLEMQCPSCSRICASAFCSTCGTRTSRINNTSVRVSVF